MTIQSPIAIIGGGMGGLSLALGLLRRNIQVVIYEAAATFKEVGLGLSIGPAAHRAMPLIDPQIREIYDSLITTHADSLGYERFKETWFEMVWASGSKSGEVMMDLKALPSGQTTVRRADFLDALVKLLPGDIARFGKRLQGLREVGDKVEMRFEDGSVETASVVIGADGIHSKVKQFVLSAEEYAQTQPRYSGMYGYRAVLDMDTMIEAVGDHRARVASIYLGDGAYGISYPIQRAKKVNVGIYPLHPEWDSESWIRPAGREDMRKDTENMGGFVKSLVEHMPDPTQWAIFQNPHISTFARSRVAILGDAAHASTPHQGAGAGQAIEDAHVLAELLGDPNVQTGKDVEAALKAYDEVRRPRSQRVVSTSADAAYLLCLRLEGVGNDEEKLKKTLQERLGWLWNCDIQGQAEHARGLMMEYINQ